MTTLTVNSKGQVSFNKDVLQHLGVKAGDKLELNILPGGISLIKASRQTGTINNFIGLLANRTKKVASIEEMNVVIEQNWAGIRSQG